MATNMGKGILPKGNLLAVRGGMNECIEQSESAGQMGTSTGFEVAPENNLLAHILSFSKYTYEGDTTFCVYWNILTCQVSLGELGSELEEGRVNFVFQHRPETADGCTS